MVMKLDPRTICFSHCTTPVHNTMHECKQAHTQILSYLIHLGNTSYHLLCINSNNNNNIKPNHAHRNTHLVDWQRIVRGVVHSVTDHLSIRFLRLIPVDHCCCGAQHPTYDLQIKRAKLNTKCKSDTNVEKV